MHTVKSMEQNPVWCCSRRRGETKSLNCFHQKANCLSPRWRMGMESHGVVTVTVNRKTWRRTFPSAAMPTTTPPWADPGANPFLRCQGSATSHLSRGTAKAQLARLIPTLNPTFHYEWLLSSARWVESTYIITHYFLWPTLILSSYVRLGIASCIFVHSHPMSYLIALAYCAHHRFDDHQSNDGGSAHLWNVGLLQRDYTALYPRRLAYSHSPPLEVEIWQE
jgi:hypothetical protein